MTRLAVLAVAGVLAAQLSAADDKAKSRSGSSSSGSSSAGARHHSSSSSSSKSSSSTSSSSGKSDSGKTSSSGSSSSDPTPAQRRHPRAGTGTGDYPYDHDDYDDYDDFSPSVYFGYPAYYYSGTTGYSGYSGGYGSGHGYHDTASLRVIVEPEKTKVYVDGYYAGTAGDFDGLFQRLHVAAGRHEVALKLDGYRTHRFQVDVPPGQTVKLRHDMLRGRGEDAVERVGEEPEVRGGPAGYARLEDERPDARVDPRGAIPAGTGRLRVDIRPPDASIYIDGIFRGPARSMDGVLLPSGRHRVQIVRPGYRTDEREIDVRDGETTELRAELERSS